MENALRKSGYLPGNRPVPYALVLFVAGCGLSLWISLLDHDAAVNRMRDRVTLAIDRIRSDLGRELYSTVSLTQGLVALVRMQGGRIRQDQFDQMAAELRQRSALIQNVALAPGNVIKFMHPLSGNEKAMGLDYCATPGQAEAVLRAIREKRTIVAGPVSLVQGGVGIIGRTPIFLDDSVAYGKPQRYWGMASTVIIFDSLVHATGIEAAGANLRIALRGKDGTGARGGAFWGDGGVFSSDPVLMEIPLPSGTWQLAAMPLRGWAAFNPAASLVFPAGFIVSLFFSFLLFKTLRISQFRAQEIRRRQATEEALWKKNRALRLFSQCNSAVVHATDEQALLERICRIAVDLAGYRMAWVGCAENDDRQTVRPVTWAGPGEGFLDKILVSWGDNEHGRGTAGNAIRSRKPAIARDILNNPDFSVWHDVLLQRDFASAIAVPLIVEKEVYGALLIYAAEPDAFDSTEVGLLDELGSNISHGMTSIRSRTERDTALAALRKSETQLSLILNNVSDAVFAVAVEPNDGFRFTSVNQSFLTITGITAGQIVGRPVRDVIPQPSLDIVLQKYRDIIRSGQPAYWEELTEYPTGKKVGQVTVAPVFDGRGICTQLVGTVHDITENKRAEEEIRKMNAGLEARVAERTAELAVAKERAEAADRLKSAFLATMSHELRTPLNSIIGFTGIILQGLVGEISPEQRKQLTMVRDSAGHLLALINDVLDISKIESGQLELRRETFDLADAIDKSVRIVRPMADKKSLPVALNVPDRLPVESDRRRVEQVLINLLNNAVKFTDKGGISLSVSAGDGPMVRISIADTGIGIKAGDLEKLFTPFKQIDSGTTRRYEGTGLGLSICKKLAVMLGGDIEAQSQGENKGSTFTFVLPEGKRRNG